MDEVKISVITVCFNAGSEIDNTINSILQQDYTDFEYIIKDGGSEDETLEIANGYMNRFADKNISFRIISDKDLGIYDAMNEALSFANGEWVLFINAGDGLHTSSLLSDVSGKLSSDYSVVYGNVMIRENGFYKLLKSGNVSDFNRTNPICHQAAFTRLDIAKRYRFNCDYKIAADFDMFLRIFKDNPNDIKYVDMIISDYLMGGLSGRRVWKREKEFDLSRRENNLERVTFPAFLITKVCFIELLRMLFVKMLGERFYSKKRGWNVL